MSDYRFVTYETLEEGKIARIMMNRPKQRNAQNRGLLVELNDAFLKAEADDEVRVVILGGVGPAFSAGHDLGSSDARAERAPAPTSISRCRPTAARRRAPSSAPSRSGTSSSRTRGAGATSARSPSRRCRATAWPPA